MSVFSSMNTSASGMSAQRLRMDTIAQNLANVNTTRTESGDPYRRKTVVFQEIKGDSRFKTLLDGYLSDYQQLGGVKVSRVVEDQRPFTVIHDPSHPDADEAGYVRMPNVNSLEEMTNLISANRSYEANVTAFNANKGMMMKALEIGR